MLRARKDKVPLDRVGLGLERALGKHNDVQEHPERPNLSLGSSVRLSFADFRRSKMHGSVELGISKILLDPRRNGGRRAKVDEFDIVVGVNDDVFVFQVAVNKTHRMHVVDRKRNLGENMATNIVGEARMGVDTLEKVARHSSSNVLLLLGSQTVKRRTVAFATGIELCGCGSHFEKSRVPHRVQLRVVRMPLSAVKFRDQNKTVRVSVMCEIANDVGVVKLAEYADFERQPAKERVRSPKVGGNFLAQDELDGDLFMSKKYGILKFIE